MQLNILLLFLTVGTFGIWLVVCMISIVNSAQSIIVVIGISDQVIAFGLHQSQHLVEVREKALFEVRSHLNNSND